MTNGLPSGWAKTSLQNCVDVLDNRRVPINSDERAKRRGSIPYYGATGQVGWIDDFLFDEELLLVGEDGAPFFDKSKPISYVIRGKTWVNNHAHVIRARSVITTNWYLKHYLDAFSFHDYVNGTTRLKLTQGSLNRIPVVLPPFEEQQRIVAKLKSVLDKVSTCKERLERIPNILKRFRQSVLAAACSGRLTANWREERQLDDEWPLHKLSDVGQVSGGITKNAKRELMGLQVPYLRVANVYENRLSLTDIFKIGVTEQELERCLLKEGDLLFVEGNGSLDQIGRVALWDGSISRCVHQNHLIKYRVGTTLLPKYALFQMMAQSGRSQLIEKATSSAGLHTLSISKISGVSLPIASLEEQQEIVRRVESLFALADQLEARYKKGKAYVDKLTQSILAKAFRGELVPQDPNDEPAEKLLARIPAEKQTRNESGQSV